MMIFPDIAFGQVPDIFIFRVENVMNTVLTTNGTDVITNYPDVGLQQQALQYIALCKEAIGKEQKLEAKR